MATDYTIPHDERLWRCLKGENTDKATEDDSLSLTETRIHLNRYDYIYIFWLSPIGFTLALLLWQLFSQGFVLTVNGWEFWKWIIDKTVYIGGIILVAFLAQKIFNENARNRENRERRLLALERMMSITGDLLKTFNEYRGCEKISEVHDQYGKMESIIIELTNTSSIYQFDSNYGAKKLKVFMDLFHEQVVISYESPFSGQDYDKQKETAYMEKFSIEHFNLRNTITMDHRITEEN